MKKNITVRSCIKQPFSVIGIQGATDDGEGFVQKLWVQANSRFSEIAHLAKRNPDGSFTGFWGAMSDISLSFKPWQDNFSKGLYLAGAEVLSDALAPEGWIKWTIPGYEYLYTEAENPDTFSDMLAYFEEHNLKLAGAVHDHTDPRTGINYMYFPVKRVDAAGAVDSFCELNCADCSTKKPAD